MDFVIERFMLFYKDLIILIVLFLGMKLFFKYVQKNHFNGPEINEKKYVDKNIKKIFFLLGIPLVYVAAPIYEEFIFRFLLIFFFPTFNQTALVVSIVVAIAFGAIHYPGNKVTKDERNAVDEPDFQKSQQVAFENLPKRQQMARKLTHVGLTSILGYIAAYMGITHQSIWYSVAVHVVWNIFIPILLPIAMLLLGMLIDLVMIRVIRPLLRGALSTYYSIWSKLHGGRLHVYQSYYGAKPKWIKWLDMY